MGFIDEAVRRPTHRSSSTSPTSPRTGPCRPCPRTSPKYKGKYDVGWDAVRESPLRAVRGMGLLTPGTPAQSPRPAGEGVGRDARRGAARDWRHRMSRLRGPDRPHRPERRPARGHARTSAASSTTRSSCSSPTTAARPRGAPAASGAASRRGLSARALRTPARPGMGQRLRHAVSPSSKWARTRAASPPR